MKRLRLLLMTALLTVLGGVVYWLLLNNRV